MADENPQGYQSHGREWERYAWVKARPVAGDIDGARERYASRIMLQLQAESGVDVDALAGCVDRYRAEAGCDVVLRYANADARAVLTLGETRVRVCNGLLDDLRGLVGAEAVQVRYRRAQTTLQ